MYLDMCCLMRPFDDLGDPRVFEEAEIVTDILELVRDGRQVLVVSATHRSENAYNPFDNRRAFLRNVFASATSFVPLTPSVHRRANMWKTYGVRHLDSYHLACAEESCVDVFCTCDDNLLRKAGRWVAGIKLLSIRQLAREIRP